MMTVKDLGLIGWYLENSFISFLGSLQLAERNSYLAWKS